MKKTDLQDKFFGCSSNIGFSSSDQAVVLYDGSDTDHQTWHLCPTSQKVNTTLFTRLEHY